MSSVTTRSHDLALMGILTLVVLDVVACEDDNIPTACLAGAALLEAETPIIIEGESIVATRTISRIPSIFTEEEWDEIRSKHTLHERGTVSNLSPDYEGIIADGLGKRKESIEARLKDETLTPEQSGPEYSGVLSYSPRGV